MQIRASSFISIHYSFTFGKGDDAVAVVDVVFSDTVRCRKRLASVCRYRTERSFFEQGGLPFASLPACLPHVAVGQRKAPYSGRRGSRNWTYKEHFKSSPIAFGRENFAKAPLGPRTPSDRMRGERGENAIRGHTHGFTGREGVGDQLKMTKNNSLKTNPIGEEVSTGTVYHFAACSFISILVPRAKERVGVFTGRAILLRRPRSWECRAGSWRRGRK